MRGREEVESGRQLHGGGVDHDGRYARWSIGRCTGSDDLLVATQI